VPEAGRVGDDVLPFWKKRYVGMGVADVRKVKQLEEEVRRLKQLVADLSLDKQMLQEALKGRW